MGHRERKQKAVNQQPRVLLGAVADHTQYNALALQCPNLDLNDPTSAQRP